MSKYTNDELRKSETFGVATLEAILSGLPVIITNAGGLPEVVGENSQFSKIVQHTSRQVMLLLKH
ncbi:glycosyltransferase [Neptunomonas phycophila]|nr:glycosyltransferase [Neptunomonas phycophila]